MSDDDTTINRIVKRLRREQYEGEERRSPDRRETPHDIFKWFPLVVVAVTAAVGYGTLTSAVDNLKEDVGELKNWNISISDRVRDLETQ